CGWRMLRSCPSSPGPTRCSRVCSSASTWRRAGAPVDAYVGNMAYTKGIHELGDGCFAYLQPDGGWGWSNAGLIVGDGTSLLVDTLFDRRLAGEMLDAMTPSTVAAPIPPLVNTHANGDHCFGNQLVEGAEIAPSTATAEEMADVPPELLAGLAAAPGEV